MASNTSQQPIQIHIDPSLQEYAVPLSQFLQVHPQYQKLVVGSFIFYPHITPALSKPSGPASDLPEPRLLIVQRASTERGFPDRWEVPGGASELTDPTILHSAARETFEETGLMLTRLIREVGRREFMIRSKKVLKLEFEIEVAEVQAHFHHGAEEVVPGDSHCKGDHPAMEDVKITLDPAEHQDYAWATEEDIRSDRYPITVPDQRQVMLDAFASRRKA